MIDRIDIRNRLANAKAESGLWHCHHPGLDSIVLETRPDGSLLRVFFASEAHSMYRLFTPEGHFTLGAHNHDKPLEFMLLFGNALHVFLNENAVPVQLFYRYLFTSQLETGKAELGPPVGCPGRLEFRPMLGWIDVDSTHTVLVSSPTAAWAVNEGPKKNVPKHIWSPRHDLSIASLGMSKLYKPMTKSALQGTCWEIADRMENENGR